MPPAHRQRQCRLLAAWVRTALQAAAFHGAMTVATSCENKTDDHGIWTGDTQVDDIYTLRCNKGYYVGVIEDDKLVQRTSVNITCHDDGNWGEDPFCSNIDDCKGLKNDCGPKGVCHDDIDGYHCVCENGAELIQATDGSNEWICSGTCGRSGENTCGSHGVCVDLKEEDPEFDSGTNSSFRCSCADGYYDDGKLCQPKDCGNLTDTYGTWHGDSKFGGEYKLTCNADSYIYDSEGANRRVTISCPKSGSWEAYGPHCFNAAQEARDANIKTARFWLALLASLICVICAALAAGLTMGLVSLQDFEMKLLMTTRKEDCDTQDQQDELVKNQKAAERVGPLLRDHHMLLVTLLLLNSIANEALPIFLDQVVPSYMAVLISVTCVLFFGEIIPSAIFTGPQHLTIASFFSPVVLFLECIFCPIAKPIAIFLDWMVGGHGNNASSRYHRAELQALLKLHQPREPVYCERAGSFPNSRSTSFGSSSPSIDYAIGERELTMALSGMSSMQAGCCGNVEAGHNGTHDNDGGDHDLHWLECTLAKRCLRLGSLRIRDLQLAPQFMPHQGYSPGVVKAPQVLRDDMTVIEAVDVLLQDTPEGMPAIAAGPGGTTISLERLLRAALLPRAPG